MVDFDRFCMSLAIKEAWKYQGLTYPNPAVGAVVVKNGKIFSIAAHKKAGEPHAEVLAIKEAYYKLSKDENILKLSDSKDIHEYLYENSKDIFKDSTIYVTLEPCNHFGKTPPCSNLLSKLKFKKVVISIKDPNKKASGGIEYLKKNRIDVKVGVLEKEGKKLIEPFVKWSKDRFIFFKLAQTINGVIAPGVISSLKSREYVHRLRDRIDLLVIGGNTVRVDRPMLDSRLIGGKNPDVLIYSKEKKFDKSIPLFNVKNREVFIENSFEKLKNYKFIMIEGGEGMLEATKDLVDWYLFFISPKIKSGKQYSLDLELNILNQQKIDKDLLIWSDNG